MFNWKKTTSLILVLGTALAGSAFAADNGKIISSASVIAKQQTGFSVKTGVKSKAVRSVEGAKQQFDVTGYTMLPYNIGFKLDSDLKSAVNVKSESVTFLRKIGAKQKIDITLQMYKGKKFNEVGVILQKEFTKLGYKRTAKVALKEKGQLPGTLVWYSGKTETAGYTLYTLKTGVLVVKHIYPLDAADGMEPLMAQLRGSLTVK